MEVGGRDVVGVGMLVGTMCDGGASLLSGFYSLIASLHKPATPYKGKHKEDFTCIQLQFSSGHNYML
jgi:hypothetical protein